MLRRHFNFAYIGFSLVFVLGIITFVWPSVVRFVLTTADRVVLFAGLLTGGIIWWQGHLIRRQMELDTTVGLYDEWNSKEMLQKRRGAWLPDKPNPETVEHVLEFLEKISTFEKGRFISRGSIWDTFGWYLWRYYFYSKDVIAEMRREWTPKAPDRTLYKQRCLVD